MGQIFKQTSTGTAPLGAPVTKPLVGYPKHQDNCCICEKEYTRLSEQNVTCSPKCTNEKYYNFCHNKGCGRRKWDRKNKLCMECTEEVLALKDAEAEDEALIFKACDTCADGSRDQHCDDGWFCLAECKRTCKPWILMRGNHWRPKSER